LTNFEKNVLLLTAEKMWRFGFGLIVQVHGSGKLFT